MTIHPILREIATLFKAHDREVCLVGGAVRDMLRGKKSHDWDLATDAPPAEVTEIFRKTQPRSTVIPTGIKHGTVTVLYRGRSMEITTYRTEADYTDGRRPDQVSYTASIEEDLSRRDFTMNAIALRLPKGGKIDPFGGEADIQAGIIRCVGNPAERFAEDGLRPLRAVRFAAQLSFRLEPETLAAIPGALETSAKVSAERVRDEIEKIIASDKPSRAFLLMEQSGLLKLFLPELAACRGIDQKGFHRFDVLEHSLLACDYAAEKQYSQDVRIAALLHDIGKAPTRKLDESGIWTFYQHEIKSEKMTRNILTRLRYPNVCIDSVCHLVKEHMFHYTDEWGDAAVRRFIVRAGEDNLAKVYQLRRADSYATAAVEPPPDFLLPLARRVEKALGESHAFSLKDLAISGKDLIALGIQPGKTLGIILDQLLETVLDDPSQNTREALLKIAEKLGEKTGGSCGGSQ
ncbi:MAG: CCA tRNA nucleotidyltransferase [Treponema sp.]|nr:CCA tRNA nucleotidyltransferase [Treponema sp.]